MQLEQLRLTAANEEDLLSGIMQKFASNQSLSRHKLEYLIIVKYPQVPYSLQFVHARPVRVHQSAAERECKGRSRIAPDAYCHVIIYASFLTQRPFITPCCIRNLHAPSRIPPFICVPIHPSLPPS